MRFVRIFLQVVIAVLAAIALIAVASSPSGIGTKLGIAAFFAFLFLLTLWLRESTEARLHRGRGVSSRVVGMILALVGVGVCWYAFDIATGWRPSPGRRVSIVNLIINVFGPWPPALVFATLGVLIIYFGYRLIRANSRLDD